MVQMAISCERSSQTASENGEQDMSAAKQQSKQHELDCYIENENYDTTSVFCSCDWSFQAKASTGNAAKRMQACKQAFRQHVLTEAGA